MKNLNLPNKITVARIFLAFIILIMLLIPWHQLGFTWTTFYVEDFLVDTKYIAAGFLFLVAALTDFVDGYIARRDNLITDFGKTMDAIADKILVNGLLIILAYQRIIPVFIPVFIITRDIITDACKCVCASKDQVVAASNLGKVKTLFVMVGITLVLFYDIPFSLIGINIGEIILLFGTVFSLISGVEYVSESLKFMDK